MKIDKKKLKWLVYILAFFLLVWLIKKTDFRLVLEAIRKIPLGLFLLCLGLQLVTESLLSYQWYRIAGSLSLSGNYGSHFSANCVESFFDAISPGAKIGGEAMRVVFLKEELGYSNQDALSLLAIQKAFSVSSFLVLAIGSSCFVFSKIAAGESFFLRAFLLGLAVFFLYLVLYFFLRSERLYSRLSKRETKGKVLRAIEKWLEGFNRHVIKLKSEPKEFIRQFVISFGVWFLYPAKLFLLVSYFKPVNFFYLLAVVFVSYFLGNLPIFPGGLLAFEGSMTVLLMSLFHIPYETAIGLSLIFRFVSYWFVLLLSMGGIFLWKSKNYLLKSREQK